MSNLKLNTLPLIIAISLCIGLLGGRYLYKGKGSSMFPSASKGNGKVDRVIATVHDQYVDTIDINDLTDNTISTMLHELDPHSRYVKAQDLKGERERMNGNFSGIGIQYSLFDDTIVVLDPIKDGPSYLAGIKRGDRIITVNKKRYTNLNLKSKDVATRLKGEKGTSVNITVWRPSSKDSLNFDVTRGEIPIASVDVGMMLNKEVGLIKINRFARTTHTEFIEQLKKLKEQGLKKLVLDLRGNPGGLLGQSIQISDEFLSNKALIMYTISREGKTEYFAEREGEAENLPLAVLVDESSASASEIVSGALQDNDKGVIVGRRTFGKGLVQQQFELKDKSAFILTIARYYTPSGRCIQRSYENGAEEYYQDLSKRLQHGELTNKDSIVFPDSLKFKTKTGRTVYGGGGIMPDVFVPLDTNYAASYVNGLYDKKIVERYALDYNLKGLSSNSVATAYQQLDKKGALKKFKTYCSKLEGYSESDFNKSEAYIKSYLYGNILRGLFGAEGLYYPRFKDNATVKTAIEKLN